MSEHSMSESNGHNGEAKPVGRPSSFSQEKADQICLRLASGETLTKVCNSDGFPAIITVFNWLEAHPEFYKHYARARNYFYARMGDDIVDHSDDGRNDWEVDEDGNRVVNHENIQRSRLRVDTRKWLLSKMLPKLYGEKVALEHSGPDGGAIKVSQTIEGELALTGLDDIREMIAKLEEPELANGNGNGRH